MLTREEKDAIAKYEAKKESQVGQEEEEDRSSREDIQISWSGGGLMRRGKKGGLHMTVGCGKMEHFNSVPD